MIKLIQKSIRRFKEWKLERRRKKPLHKKIERSGVGGLQVDPIDLIESPEGERALREIEKYCGKR